MGRHGAEHSVISVPGFGGAWAAGFAASVRTPPEGKVGADTAAWTQVIQGHSQELRHRKRKRDRDAGLNVACGVSLQPEGRVG